VTRIHLASGLARRGNTVLLVASTYASHDDPLWNLPGGRQEARELLPQTVEREVYEETNLRAIVGELAYIAESYDGEQHFISSVFEIEVEGTVALPKGDDHVVAIEWVPIAALADHLHVRVVREPLLAYLSGAARYSGFPEAGISIRWRSST
jgi:8-oxo-dGTP pyrophosphatase MutT (NUDIX family)